MYTPKPFREDRLDVLHAFIREHPFATIVNAGPDGPLATHAPVELDADAGRQGVLIGHLAKANPQWKTMQAAGPTLVVFHGPQAYVSPSFYPSKKDHGRVVPTWDYVAVHARGRAETFDDPDDLRALLEKLTRRHEHPRPEPWSLDDAPEDFLRGAMGAIVGFRIEIETLEGQWKVSQNRSQADRRGVIDGLQEGDEQARAIAAQVPSGDST